MDRQIGPYHLTSVGRLIAVSGPGDDPVVLAALRRAQAEWDKGTRRWWVEARRVRRLERDLERAAEPLLRWRA